VNIYLEAEMKTHGLSGHPLYRIWRGMIRRTTNPNHPDWEFYGGRGISVCKKWMDFLVFYKEMISTYREDLSLDRVDNNRGYCKSNCRWTDRSTQAQNTRVIHANNTSGFRGVTWNKRCGKWQGQIRVNGHLYFLGLYESKESAAIAYNSYILKNGTAHPLNEVKSKQLLMEF
jgi:hypothetical protein